MTTEVKFAFKRTDLHLLILFLILFILWFLLPGFVGVVVISDDHSAVLLVTLFWVQDLQGTQEHLYYYHLESYQCSLHEQND